MKMKNYNLFYFAALIFCFCLSGCKDLIDEDITGKDLQILSPADNFVASNYDVLFWWEKMDEATKYHIQIVSPSFDNIQKLIADTLTSLNQVNFNLYPGQYQWKIRAENGSSFTTYIIRNLKVDTNSDFTNQTFTVSTPMDNYYSNNKIVNFSWQGFPFATSYQYILYDGSNNIIKTRSASQSLLTDTIQNEGAFTWQVKAINGINNTSTQFSVPRNIYIDVTPPVVSTPIFPSYNSLDTNPISLRWVRPSDVLGDSVFVSTDSLFQTTTVKTYITADTFYTLQPLVVNQTYFWQLRSKDKAGNNSTYSQVYRFTVGF